jgi:excisionase family DNA binding protein
MAEKTERLTYSIKEAAIILSISRNLAYQLAKDGKLPGVIRLGRKRMVVSRAALARVLEGDSRSPSSGNGQS